ncbi:MAG: tyrosine--tRNA ligase [bacterium]|nr:tyrosine--tRNA ligase [bacterium]
MTKQEKVTELLHRGVAEVIVQEHLEKKLLSGKKLRIKFGIDPTGDCIHIGHAVALLKLKEFQDLGHTIIFLIGDHTAEIGDPSGRSKERVPLTNEHIKKNMASYQKQAGLILDMSKVEVRKNSEWYNKLGIMEFAKLTSTVTIAQILQRADFKKRLAAGEDISLREAFYPLLQGYDSVMLKSDIEIGGTDQKFNLLMGRQAQKKYNQEEQDVLMIPLLEGLDGSDKMSKSAGNFIALTDSPCEMYSKVMSIPDSLLWKYFRLATRVPVDEIREIEQSVKQGVNPRDAKMRLAREIVTLYYGTGKSKVAEEEFVNVFQKKEIPDDIPTLTLRDGLSILEILVAAKFVSSKGEGRRLVAQGGISWDDTVIAMDSFIPPLSLEGNILKKGKRHFVKILKK